MTAWTSYIALSLGIGYLLDLLFGDPKWFYHPVRLIGKIIQRLEVWIRLRFSGNPQKERRGGALLVLGICLFCLFFPWGILILAGWIHPYFGIFLEIFLCFRLLAVKSLRTESMKVYLALKEEDLEQARKAVSMIVGRDTERLDKRGVTKAATETVAENFADGVIAPMFYMAVGGPVLMFLYKGINTMDSMIGYKNERYLNFGRYGAKLDDIANFIPARIAALFLLLAGAVMKIFCGLWNEDFRRISVRRGWQIFKRDRFHHASPNSAQTEAAMAGLLGIQLAGDAWYFGQLYQKPYIGDDSRAAEPEDICRANRLMYCGSAIAAAVFCTLRLTAEFLLEFL